MPIKVSCQCGASFAAKDELAGKAVRCPKCKQPLKIPTPAAAPVRAPAGALDDLFDEAGISAKKGPSCPKCNAELKPNAILCVACGFELQTGEHREGVKIQGTSHSGHGGQGDSTEAVLARAARQIEYDKAEDRKNITHGSPAYVYLFGLAVIIAFATMMFTMPKGLAFYITGWSLIAFANLIQIYYNIRFIVAAFQEDVKQGFLQFVPFYSLYYLITRWDRVGKWFLKALSMIPLAVLGSLFVLLGLWLGLTRQEKDNALLRHQSQPLVTSVTEHDSGRHQSL